MVGVCLGVEMSGWLCGDQVWRRVECVCAIGGKSHQYGKAVAIVGAAGAMWVERHGWRVFGGLK